MTETPQGTPTGPGPEAPQGANRTTPASEPTTPEGYIPQAEVSKIAAREKGEGRQAAINKLLEDTGAENLDDVLAAYREYTEIQDAVTSESEKANTARDRAYAERDSWKNLYFEEKRSNALRGALRDAGINAERIGSALKIGDLSKIEVDTKTGAVSGVEEVVQAVQEESPEWFGNSATKASAPDANRRPVMADAVEPGYMRLMKAYGQR